MERRALPGLISGRIPGAATWRFRRSAGWQPAWDAIETRKLCLNKEHRKPATSRRSGFRRNVVVPSCARSRICPQIDKAARIWLNYAVAAQIRAPCWSRMRGNRTPKRLGRGERRAATRAQATFKAKPVS